MKKTFTLLASLIASMGCFAAVGSAQDYAPPARQTSYFQTEPVSVQEIAGTTAVESSPAPATASTAAPAAEESSDAPTSRWCRCGKMSEPWTLPQPKALSDHNITVGGWASGGIYGNQYGAPSNGPIGYRNVGDGATFDQFNVFAERKTNGENGWDFGGRVDYMFGADALDVQTFGDRTWDYDWKTARDYGSAMPQLYAEVAYHDLKVKGGHFYTPIGYEVTPATGNFFYSHSYSLTYGEPVTHTGALSEYALNDKIKIYNGWVGGCDAGWANKNEGSMYLGGFALTLSERATLSWYCMAGNLRQRRSLHGRLERQSISRQHRLQLQIERKWTYAVSHDLGTNYDLNNGGADNQWYGISNYLFYTVSDCWSYGGRFEWFQDPQGAKVIAGTMGNYYALTAGVNWKPHANVTIRPEIRYDWFDGTAGANGLPFNDGTASSQLSGGFDAVFTF